MGGAEAVGLGVGGITWTPVVPNRGEKIEKNRKNLVKIAR